MEVDIRYSCGDKYIEMTVREGNTEMKSGLLNKKEAQRLAEQFAQAFSEINTMYVEDQ